MPYGTLPYVSVNISSAPVVENQECWFVNGAGCWTARQSLPCSASTERHGKIRRRRHPRAMSTLSASPRTNNVPTPPLGMTTEGSTRDNAHPDARRPPPRPSRSLFSIPTPMKQLFDRFPIFSYSANELPQRAPRKRDAHTLYVFTTDRGVEQGAPSFNPGCLKWQVGAEISVASSPLLTQPRHISSSRASSFA